MQITFTYPSGRRVVAAVLAVGSDFIRVVAPRHTDGFDLYLRDQNWVTESGKLVRVESILLGANTRFPEAVPEKPGRSTRKTIRAARAPAS